MRAVIVVTARTPAAPLGPALTDGNPTGAIQRHHCHASTPTATTRLQQLAAPLSVRPAGAAAGGSDGGSSVVVHLSRVQRRPGHRARRFCCLSCSSSARVAAAGVQQWARAVHVTASRPAAAGAIGTSACAGPAAGRVTSSRGWCSGSSSSSSARHVCSSSSSSSRWWCPRAAAAAAAPRAARRRRCRSSSSGGGRRC
jgi:hypothetical protein